MNKLEKFYRTLQLLSTKFLYCDPEGEGETGATEDTLPVEAPVVKTENNEQDESDKEMLNSLGLNAEKFDMEKIKDARYVSDTGLDTGRPGDKKEDAKEEESKEIYKINKEEFSRSDIEKKMSEKFKVDFSKFSKEEADQVIKEFVDMQNVTEGKRNVDRGNQYNAAEKKRLEKLQTDLESEKASVKSQFQLEREAFKNEKAELLKEIADLKKDIEDEEDEYKRLEMITDKKIAEKELSKVEKTGNKISEKEKEALKILKAKDEAQKQAQDDYDISTMVDALQGNFPELQTGKEVIDVLWNIRNGNIKQGIDGVVTKMIKRIINEYNDEYRGVQKKPPITEYYEEFKYLYPLPQRNGEKKDEKPVSEKIKEHKEIKSTENAIEQTKNYAPLPKSNLTPTPTGKPSPSKDDILRDLGHLN